MTKTNLLANGRGIETMKRRLILAGFCAALLVAPEAWAQGFADQVVQQLRQQGYGGISVSNTWLGRTRIVARSGDGMREIIIDPRTGEILRDLWETGGGGGQTIIDDRGGSGRDSGGSGGGGTPSQDDDPDDDPDEDRDDDPDEDPDEEDNSGRGSGESSGSGGGSDDDEEDDKDD